jgi:hypothetical protein
MPNHPNATVAGGSAGVSVLIVWVAGHFGVDLGAEEAIVLAGLLTVAVLAVGRDGVTGIAHRVWRGTGK